MRIKAGQATRKGKKKIFRLAKGAYSSKSKNWRHVLQHVEKSLDRSYTGRKDRKGEFRSLWIARINAACRQHDMSYSKFIAGLKKAGITINRKMLSEMVLRDEPSFNKIVSLAAA